MTALRILHLWPRELGINGDVGNVTALVRRAAWAGVEVEVLAHHSGGALPERVDAVHVGSGPLSSQRQVHADALSIADTLCAWHADGVPILAIGAGWQLLGHELVLPDGESIRGAGVFPSRAVLGVSRSVGETVVETPDGDIAGFENHSATTVLENGAAPLGRVRAGYGNTGRVDDAAEIFEGVRVGESVGSHLHGAVLALNPRLADRMLAAIAARVGAGLDSTMLAASAQTVDEYAANARKAMAARLRTTITV